MIDQNKRNTLKTLSLASASAAIPAVAALRSSNASAAPAMKTGGLEMSVESATALTPSRLVIKNPTTSAVTLRHVAPGLVKSKGELFDINQLLRHQAVTVQPGQTRVFAIDPMRPGETEISSPGGVIASDMASVTTRYRHATGDGFTTTRRMTLS